MITVNGKDYGLFLSVSSATEIAKLCPYEDLSHLYDILFSDNLPESNSSIIAFVSALSAGYEARQAFLVPGYEPNPLTPEELGNITLRELWAARDAGIETFISGLQVTVEVDEPKKKETATKSI